LRKLGFEGTDPAETGRPAYHPSVHLKLHNLLLHNRVQPSRWLGARRRTNVKVMWLLSRIAPDHKNIADFRKDKRPDHGVHAVGETMP